MSAQPKRKYTVEEYFTLERNSETRYEYWDGKVFAMSGASPNHTRIKDDLSGELYSQLKGRPCEIFTSNQRVKASTASRYVYPDVVVVCGEPRFETIQGLETLLNPILVVEVLSPSTAWKDLDQKFQHYLATPSVQEYVVISSHRVYVAQYRREPDATWKLTQANDLADSITFASIGCTVGLEAIYRRVKFEETEAAEHDETR